MFVLVLGVECCVLDEASSTLNIQISRHTQGAWCGGIRYMDPAYLTSMVEGMGEGFLNMGHMKRDSCTVE